MRPPHSPEGHAPRGADHARPSARRLHGWRANTFGCSLLFAVALLFFAREGHAQPLVRIRAESRLELTATASDTHVEVKGVLRDDQGSGLGQQAIAVHLIPKGASHDDPARQSTLLSDPSTLRRTRTDPAGAFAVRMKSPPDGYELEARFEGNTYQTPAVVRRAAPGKAADLALDLRVASREINLNEPTQSVTVVAQGPPPLKGIPLRLENELGTLLSEGRTDGTGRWETSIQSEHLGPPGPGRLRAITEGTERWSAAAVELGVTRVVQAILSLRTTPDPPTAGQAVRVEGYLGGPRGGLGRKAVGFFDGETHLGTRLTDADGTFAHDLELAADVRSLRAVFTSDTPGMTDASTPPRAVSPPRTVPVAYKALPTLVLIVLLAVMWWRRERPAPTPRRLTEAPSPRLVQPPRSGPRRWVLELKVVDHERGAPLSDAEVCLAQGGKVVSQASSSADGMVSLTGGEGRFELAVEAPGHERQSHTLVLPHRGEWLGAEVRLRPLRQVAWQSLSPVRAAIRGRAVQPDAWTATEVAERVREKDAAAGTDAEELAHRVDALTFGKQGPTRADVDALRDGGASLASRLEGSPRRPR